MSFRIVEVKDWIITTAEYNALVNTVQKSIGP
jgi:hypothetical protein